jgi:hypothetical protein
MMEAADISETLVNFYQTTRHDIPEDVITILAAVITLNLTKHNGYPLPKLIG